jgi:hypothetical protein
MSLFELQKWLGHRSPETTKHYAKITPTKLAKSYADAGYFERKHPAGGSLDRPGYSANRTSQQR